MNKEDINIIVSRAWENPK